MKKSGVVDQTFILAGAIVGLATIAFVIAKGDKTAKVIKAAGKVFTDAITAATGGKGGFA